MNLKRPHCHNQHLASSLLILLYMPASVSSWSRISFPSVSLTAPHSRTSKYPIKSLHRKGPPTNKLGHKHNADHSTENYSISERQWWRYRILWKWCTSRGFWLFAAVHLTHLKTCLDPYPSSDWSRTRSIPGTIRSHHQREFLWGFPWKMISHLSRERGRGIYADEAKTSFWFLELQADFWI